MRSCLVALCLACFPIVALADSVQTLQVIDGTRSRIESFSMAPAGSDHWTMVDLKGLVQEPSFGYEMVITLAVRDDDGCLRDLRTVLTGGRQIVVRNFDLCHSHAYWPGRRVRNGHPGSQTMS
jgi:hypothetical protein